MQATKNNNKDYCFDVYTFADGCRSEQVLIDSFEISAPNICLALSHFLLHALSYNFDAPSKYCLGSIHTVINYQYDVKMFVWPTQQQLFGDDIVKWTLINEFCL